MSVRRAPPDGMPSSLGLAGVQTVVPDHRHVNSAAHDSRLSAAAEARQPGGPPPRTFASRQKQQQRPAECSSRSRAGAAIRAAIRKGRRPALALGLGFRRQAHTYHQYASGLPCTRRQPGIHPGDAEFPTHDTRRPPARPRPRSAPFRPCTHRASAAACRPGRRGGGSCATPCPTAGAAAGVVRQLVARADLAHPGGDLAVAGAGHVRVEVVLDLVAEVAAHHVEQRAAIDVRRADQLATTSRRGSRPRFRPRRTCRSGRESARRK